MQMKISTKLAKYNKPLGNFTFKHFQAISVIFVVLMFGSLAYGAYGIYNWVVFGNCNGQQGGDCVLNDLTGNPNIEKCDQNAIINDLNNNLDSITISKGTAGS